MNDSDQQFEEYLRRQSPVSERYRELNGEEVPPALDQRILAQARAAAQSSTGSRVRMASRWIKPVALAASVALVVMVTVKIGTERDATENLEAPVIETTTVSAPTPSALQDRIEEKTIEVAPPAPAQPTVKPAAPRNKKASAAPRIAPPTTAPAVVLQQEPLLEEALMVEPANTAAASSVIAAQKNVAALPPSFSSSAPAATQAAAARRESEERKAPAGLQIAQTAIVEMSAEERDRLRLQAEPEPWLEYIRGLRKEGKTQAADEEWQRFVLRWPNYSVAETDTARSAAKP